MRKVSLNAVDDIRAIELPRHVRNDGEIVIAQAAAQVPFAIARMFVLTASLDARRGEHAHRLCSQFMLCVAGAVEILCDDGNNRKSFTLDRNSLAIYVPPTIWNTVIFRQDMSVVVVLCDRPFEETDYLRSYAEFLEFREANLA